MQQTRQPTAQATAKALEIARRIAPTVAYLTDINDHTGSLIVIAKAFNYQGSLMELKTIQSKQASLGYITTRDYTNRKSIHDRILNLVKELSPEAANILRGSL